jgi:hypothetical protein
MKTKILFLLIICLSLDPRLLRAQDSENNIQHMISMKSKFTQIKDEFNYGLVNNGFNPGIEYSLVSGTEKNIIIYRTELDFGANFKKGLGMAWSLKPVDLFYGFRVNRNPEILVTLGPYIAGNYKWMLFPFLQSGKMFWISSWELGPRIMVSLPYKEKIISVSIANSVAGLVSRPLMKTEEYFYSLSLLDFVRNPHTNMTFGLQNVFNHTSLNVELTGQGKKRSLSYEFEFMGYMKEPMFRYLSHSINLKWKIANKKLK